MLTYVRSDTSCDVLPSAIEPLVFFRFLPLDDDGGPRTIPLQESIFPMSRSTIPLLCMLDYRHELDQGVSPSFRAAMSSTSDDLRKGLVCLRMAFVALARPWYNAELDVFCTSHTVHKDDSTTHHPPHSIQTCASSLLSKRLVPSFTAGHARNNEAHSRLACWALATRAIRKFHTKVSTMTLITQKQQHFAREMLFHSATAATCRRKCRIWSYSTIMSEQRAYTSAPRKSAGGLLDRR